MQYIVEKYSTEILKNVGSKVLAQHYRRIAKFYLNAGERQRACKFFYLAYINNRADFRLLGRAIWALSGRKVFPDQQLQLLIKLVELYKELLIKFRQDCRFLCKQGQPH
jgi:hypothetical protein